MDLGRPYSVICFDDGGRKVLRRFRLGREGVERWFKDRARCRVLLESATESEWVARYLEGLGHEVVVADPNYAPMYVERSRRVKTDNRDAEALYEANRLGIYRRAHRRSDARRRVMELLGTRECLQRTRTRWINSMRAMLRREGWHVPSGDAAFFLERVRSLGLPREVLLRLQPFAQMWEPLNQEIAELDRSIARIGDQDREVRLLRSAPQIGPVTAAAVVALIDDPHRFGKAHQLESYLGLVPSEWSSSEKQRRGGITRRGDTRARWLLVEAAWGILRSRRLECQGLRRWAEGIATRRGKKVAVVALARRLAGILWAMLRTATPFDATRLARPLTAAA
jgi:transposase